MVISRTPLRISLSGGTDVPEFLREYGEGFAITIGITLYVYIVVKKTFDGGYVLKYSENENAATIDAIKHPILRETLRLYQVPTGTEIVSLADVPSGTGLGSSGAFTVGLCRALSTTLTQHELAERAAHVELGILRKMGGKQDHYATALGGMRTLEFHHNGTVVAKELAVGPTTLQRLESGLRLYYTGFSRDADTILATQSIDGLNIINAHGHASKHYLECGDVESFADLMNDHWRIKRERSPDMTNEHIDHFYDVAMANGAMGGKLVGAGGGGFLLFFARDHGRLHAAMSAEGLTETPFSFDHVGTTLIDGA